MSFRVGRFGGRDSTADPGGAFPLLGEVPGEHSLAFGDALSDGGGFVGEEEGLVGVDGGDGVVLGGIVDEFWSITRGREEVSEGATGKGESRRVADLEMQMAERQVLRVSRPYSVAGRCAAGAGPRSWTQTGALSLAKQVYLCDSGWEGGAAAVG